MEVYSVITICKVSGVNFSLFHSNNTAVKLSGPVENMTILMILESIPENLNFEVPFLGCY